MSKAKFSSSVGDSLRGRRKDVEVAAIPEQKSEKPNDTVSVPASKNSPGHIAEGKKKAGRKAMKESEKKKQIVLTIKPETMKALEEVDPDFKKLLNRYLDKDINQIVEILKKL